MYRMCDLLAPVFAELVASILTGTYVKHFAQKGVAVDIIIAGYTH